MKMMKDQNNIFWYIIHLFRLVSVQFFIIRIFLVGNLLLGLQRNVNSFTITHFPVQSASVIEITGRRYGYKHQMVINPMSIIEDIESNTDDTTTSTSMKDNRPFLQRVNGPRPARRMNHPFKYLYRHGFNETTMSTDPFQFLINEGGFTEQQVLKMNQTFPVLLELSVQSQLYPKVQFLKQTLEIKDPVSVIDLLPPQYFGARLEKILAPRHAFLVWLGLPHGKDLLYKNDKSNKNLFQQFMNTGRKTKQFAAMCQTWCNQGLRDVETDIPISNGRISSKHVEAFDAIFSRGLLAAVRDDLVQTNNTWPIEILPSITASDVAKLLIQHGANPIAKDHRGATLLHWACGTGHADVVEHLLPYLSVWTKASRDGSTPLHWAAAGTTAREFGVGGHVDICRELLSYVKSLPQDDGQNSVSSYVNALTYDGNSALMWAAWSGTLDTVKLLCRSKADTTVANRNGCTVAYWAASGGDLAVCKYLKDTFNVDFTIPNHGGNTPLTHAVAFGRLDVVEWLLQVISETENKVDEVMARSLAQDFVQWTEGKDKDRKKVLDLFDNSWFESEFVELSEDEILEA